MSPATSWTELTTDETPWEPNVYKLGYAGDVVLIGGIAMPVMPDGSSALIEETTYTELSVAATSHTELTTPSTTWTELT